jgi:hypothetical protein
VQGIAEQGGVTFRDPAVAQQKKNCIEGEQAVRAQVLKAWSSFVADDRTHCVNETTMGGLSSYTELITCLEMARDVRALRSAAASSGEGIARTPSSPSTSMVQPAQSTVTVQSDTADACVQPTPPDSALRPSSAIEPTKMGVDSTLLKELQQAKTDALDARTSEAAVRRKLGSRFKASEGRSHTSEPRSKTGKSGRTRGTGIVGKGRKEAR